MQSNDLSLPVVSLSQIATKGGLPLNGLSLSVLPGEILTLLGAEAATVLNVIAGFARPVAGELVISGIWALKAPLHRRGVAMVSRGLDLFPHLTVLGHAEFAPGVTRAAALALLERLDLLGVARAMPQTLSPEQQLRTALARALSRGPAVLLLDNPFTAITLREADRLKSWLRAEVARQDAERLGLAIVHQTDDAAGAYCFADRIAAIEGGQLRQTGTAQELYERPDSLFVAQAMGELNLLPGVVHAIEDDIAEVRLAGGVLVEGRAADNLAPGAACILAVRPERIAIAAMNPVDLGGGALAATLHEVVFAGDHMRLNVQVDLHQGHTADLRVIRPSGANLPRIGSLSLAWQAHHAHVFAVEAG